MQAPQFSLRPASSLGWGIWEGIRNVCHLLSIIFTIYFLGSNVFKLPVLALRSTFYPYHQKLFSTPLDAKVYTQVYRLYLSLAVV